jgi:hypothetical protein
MALAEFESAVRARHALQDRYRLLAREAYVLRSAPVRGFSRAASLRRRDESARGRIETILASKRGKP